jgi:hypothetical protein
VDCVLGVFLENRTTSRKAAEERKGKLPVSDCSFDDETTETAPLEVDLMTAWEPPVPILVALVNRYHCHAELAYYEPGMNYRGFAVADWQDGETLWDDQSWDMTEKDWQELDLLPD